MTSPHLRLPFDEAERSFAERIRAFVWEGRPTLSDVTRVPGPHGRPDEVVTFVNEFWTARQRAAHSLHEVSYRACFKPQLPRFFIERLTAPGGLVYDPFMGRGTTLLEAALLGRSPAGSDVNPLSRVLLLPRLDPPALGEVAAALDAVDLHDVDEHPEDLLVFYHPDTLREICALKKHLRRLEQTGTLSRADAWVRMVAVNRLTGHSPGFFSVYTLPPNQATSVVAQRRINAKRSQTPPRRDVGRLILKKSRHLLRDCDGTLRDTFERVRSGVQVITGPASSTPALATGSVDLVVTSPPFLDVVDYRGDNWLRCWFCGVDASAVDVSTPREVATWQGFITGAFTELSRVVRPGGHVAFEVGEVKGGTVKLEEAVIPCGVRAGFEPVLVLINAQIFTKTANCWGVDNNRRGTNTNRVVVFRKP
jgi:hypothetical protein